MNYGRIKTFDMVDGPGIRVTLFVSGCSTHCEKCQNPETWDPNFGQLFTEQSFNEIISALKEDWCSGLTLCGGDPLFYLNREDIAALVKRIKKLFPEKSIWMYTGYTLDQVKNMMKADANVALIINTIDVILEGPYIYKLNDPDKHWVGSSNQNVYKINHLNNEVVFSLYE